MNKEIDGIVHKYEKLLDITIPKTVRKQMSFGLNETVTVEKYDKEGKLVEKRLINKGE